MGGDRVAAALSKVFGPGRPSIFRPGGNRIGPLTLPGPHRRTRPADTNRETAVITLRRVVPGVLSVAALAISAVLSPVSAQDAERSPTLQAGPYIGGTTGGMGAKLEYGLRVGMSRGTWRADLTGSAIPIAAASGCNPSSPACRDVVHVEVLAGISRSLGTSPNAASLGFRAGLAKQESLFGPPLMLATGPHLSVGIPIHAAVGLRTEAGVRTYLAWGHLPGFRAYISLGVVGHR